MSEVMPPKVSSVLAGLVAEACAVYAQPRHATGERLDRLRARVEAQAGSPRSVGLIDRHTVALLDALDALAYAEAVGNDRTQIWRQVVGVLLPEVQADVHAALHREAGG